MSHTVLMEGSTSQKVVKPWQVASQLARLEARKVGFHPATLLGLALALWGMWEYNAGQAPVLNRVGTNISLPLVLLAGGALIATSQAAVRMWKTEQSEAIDVAPASSRTRTAALLVGSILPVVMALAIQLGALLVAVLNDPVTSLDWFEVLAGPATVTFAVSAGVAAGRWAPSRFTGPLTLVALLGVSVYLSTYDVAAHLGQHIRWLTPIVPLEFDPVELAFRPSGRHLIYLAGVMGVFVSLALLRGKIRRVWIPVIMLALSAGVAVVGAIAQADAYRDFDREQRLATLLPPEADYVCEQHEGVTYCAYPEYDSWIAEWAGLVEPVLDLTPAEVRSRPLTVRQYPTRAVDQLLNGSDLSIAHEPSLATGMWWGRQVGTDGAEWGDAYPYGMALGAAAWAVGLPLEPIAGRWDFDPTDPEDIPRFIPGTEGLALDEISYQACDTWDQGRAVVALWMAAQASPVTEQHLRNQIERPRNPIVETFEEDSGEMFQAYNLSDTIGVGQPYPWYALEFHKREAYYAYQLLDQPKDRIVARVHASWDLLTDPDTTTLEALAVLGVEPLGEYEGRNEGVPWPDSYPPCS